MGGLAWIVYFRQRDDVPARLSGYAINGVMHSVSLKGRAWIIADSYQIAHMETDMVKPMPEIQLFLEHISVNYKPVRFHARGEDVWLPANANLYIEFRKHPVPPARYFYALPIVFRGLKRESLRENGRRTRQECCRVRAQFAVGSHFFSVLRGAPPLSLSPPPPLSLSLSLFFFFFFSPPPPFLD